MGYGFTDTTTDMFCCRGITTRAVILVQPLLPFPDRAGVFSLEFSWVGYMDGSRPRRRNVPGFYLGETGSSFENNFSLFALDPLCFFDLGRDRVDAK